MRILFVIILMVPALVFGRGNIELQARFVKQDKKYIYMESKDTHYKLAKKELTKAGIKQILSYKDKELTMFVPPKSIVKKTAKTQEEMEME